MGGKCIQLIGIPAVLTCVLLCGCIEDAGKDIGKGIEKAEEVTGKVGEDAKVSSARQQARSKCLLKNKLVNLYSYNPYIMIWTNNI